MTPSPRELATLKAQARREQEHLFQDLLGVLDALDHACDHWHQAEQDHQSQQPVTTALAVRSRSPWQRQLEQWRRWIRSWLRKLPFVKSTARTTSTEAPVAEAMAEMLSSARDGVEMIRRSLLEVLHQRQVVPLTVLGQPFNSEQMYALGRQATTETAENTVVQEVVRGYVWQNRILREAQVIVSYKPPPTDESQN